MPVNGIYLRSSLANSANNAESVMSKLKLYPLSVVLGSKQRQQRPGHTEDVTNGLPVSLDMIHIT